MKTRTLPLLFLSFALAAGCSQGQDKNTLPPQAFADKLKTTTEGTLIDVRTTEEFSEGHLAGAKNYDWNGGHYEHQVMALDKTKPVFVYCTKGSRSASAAEKMRSMGFKVVFELEGGLNKWQSSNLPIVKD